MTDIQPFQIEIPEQQLTDLQQRLALTRLPEKETPADWSQGVPLAYAQELAAYWRDEYDWRRWESRMNVWDHRRVGDDQTPGEVHQSLGIGGFRVQRT